MGYAFGKAFDYYFYPLVDNEELTAVPSQTPSIFIFSDANGQPSRDTAAAGTGATQTISTWTSVTGGFKIEVDALTDPDPSSAIDCRTYWVAINFKLKTGGQTQTVLRALDMERVAAHNTRLTVTPTDLTTLFPEISSFATNTTISAAISLAQEECKSILLSKGYEWAQIKRPERLKLAIQSRSMMQLMLNQRKVPGDNFDANYSEYKKQYKSYLDSIQLEIDRDKDGVAETKNQLFGYAVVSR